MTRIDTTDETVSNLQKEVSSLKRQVETERRHRSRKFYVKLGIFLLVIASLVIGGGYAMARSGVYVARGFGWVPYAQPEPLRPVTPRGVDTTKLINAAKTASKKDIPLSFSEEELTGVLRQALVTDADQPYFSQIQMAVTPEEVEVFGELLRPVRGFITLGIVPRAHDGELTLDVQRLRFGQLPLPAGAANGIVRITAERTLNSLFHQLGRYGTLSSVELREGTMTIHITPSHDE